MIRNLAGSAVTDKTKQTEKTISVVIPTYRRPDDIVLCLKALEKQNRRPDQVIITIRPEDTGTWERVTEFKGQTDLPLDLVLIEEPGVVKALNAGLKAVKTTIVCFTDDDARAHPDWLERIGRYYDDPHVGGVGGRDMVYTDGKLEEGQVDKVGRVNWFGRRHGNHHLELIGGRPVDVKTLKGVNSSYLSELVDQFDLRLLGVTQVAYEDDMGLSIVKKGFRLVYDPQILVDHYPSKKRPEARGQEIYHDQKQVFNTNHNYTYVLLKHLPFWQQILFLLYNFAIGDSPCYGLVRTLYSVAKTRQLRYFKLLGVAYRGKVRGIRTYLRYRRETDTTR